MTNKVEYINGQAPAHLGGSGWIV